MKKFILNPYRIQGQGLGVIMGYLATAYSISKSLICANPYWIELISEWFKI